MKIEPSGHFSEYLLNSIPVACYLLDRDSKFVYLNREAERFFELEKHTVIGRNVWEVFPESRTTHCYTSINLALSGRQSGAYEYISAVSNLWISLTAYPADNGGAIVMFSEIDALKASKNQYQALVDNTPDTISRWNSKLQLLFANQVYIQKTGRTLEKLLGRTMIDIGQSPEVALPWMEKMKLVFDTGKAQEHYHSYPGPYGELFYFSKMVPELDSQGAIQSVLSIDRDITALKKAEQELESQTHFIHSIMETLPDVVSVVRLPSRKLEYINRDPLMMVGYTRDEMIDMPANQGTDHLVHPDDLQSLLDYYEHISALKDGETAQLEYRAQHKNGKYSWLCLRGTIFRRNQDGEPTYAFHTWQDITQQKNAELELKKNLDMLQSVFDSTLLGMCVLQAVRDERGLINDFLIKMVSKELENETKRKDLIGKLYFQEYPDLRSSGLFELMLRVLETGEPAGKEYPYAYDGIEKWFSCKIVKMGDALVSTSMDITERRNAEKAIRENAALINSIADSAPDMVYAIDLVHMKQIYSNYKIATLLNKSQQEIRHLDISFYDEFIHPEDRNNFYNNLAELRNADNSQVSELTYRLIDANGNVHWIRTRRSVYKYDESGRPSHIVGVSEDITVQRELQDKNHQLWLQHNEAKKQQRQEIFRVTLKVQEQERKRISETLHNGIGQILYGIKLTLDRLRVNLPNVGHDQQSILNEAQDLLTKCIRENRRISHELMPPALEDFGLKAAIEDVCWQLRGEVSFNCHFTGDPLALDKYIQLSIYRIVQELMVNIIKHAQATHGVVRIVIEHKATRIEVEDNGSGFTWSEAKNKGIGLSTIQANVKLLNGKTEIKSDASGTNVQITLPIDLTANSAES
ncbi:PAS domain S-box protein [Pedobacter sp. V48]|uniref:PAS domain-containing sensor histidine kinase n=1 Tax=Pedobacter sp. V48 TaxID=509635 RepID=UPI0003E5A19F|nr:PAS domain S-box protein [Pedobacter sp. V48]ETZ23027.1 hypothetical protein N824_20540 [Pedobacter sp. V48]